jgi:hypothetical protein
VNNPPLRTDIRPLCPRHDARMNGNNDATDQDFVCPEQGCTFHWRFLDGYFQLNDGVVHYPPDAYQFLKPALLREHGYLYIALVQGASPRKRAWRCAVKDCPNMIVEEV